MRVAEVIKPQYLVDKRGRKKAVVLNLRQYKEILEMIEDLEDANDLLRSEREATAFSPYEEFRKTWLKS